MKNILSIKNFVFILTAFSAGHLLFSQEMWTPTSVGSNVPSQRSIHTAIWTGSILGGKMIIWGGSNGTSLNTGGVYDPITDLWTATSLVNAPAIRAAHSAVWTGSKMIVWGGAANFV